jgi:hypothetical protein
MEHWCLRLSCRAFITLIFWQRYFVSWALRSAPFACLEDNSKSDKTVYSSVLKNSVCRLLVLANAQATDEREFEGWPQEVDSET